MKIRRTPRFFVSVFVAVAAALTFVTFVYYVRHNKAAANPVPGWAQDELENQPKLMLRIRNGDVVATTDLATAMMFDGRDSEAVDVMRYFLSNHDDRNIDGQLGELLMNSVMRDARDGGEINFARRSEALALLRLASLQGNERAEVVLDMYKSLGLGGN